MSLKVNRFLLVIICTGIASKQVLAEAPLYPPAPPSYVQKGGSVISREDLPAELRQREADVVKKLNTTGYLEISDSAIDGFEQNLDRSYEIVNLKDTGNSVSGQSDVRGVIVLDRILGRPRVYPLKIRTHSYEIIRIYSGANKEIIAFKVRDLSVGGLQVRAKAAE